MVIPLIITLLFNYSNYDGYYYHYHSLYITQYPTIIPLLLPLYTLYLFHSKRPIGSRALSPSSAVAFTVPWPSRCRRRHEESRHRGHGAAGDQVWMDLGMI